jgi:hypothetical protein
LPMRISAIFTVSDLSVGRRRNATSLGRTTFHECATPTRSDYNPHSGDQMPRPKKDAHIYELAKRGAEARLRDLVQETKYLIDLFPHLRDSYDKDELPLKFIMAEGSGAATKTAAAERPRRRLSAAARKAISQRMKGYWARRRKGAAKG